MTAELSMTLAILLPLVGGGIILAVGRSPNLREAVTIVTSLLLFADIFWLAQSGVVSSNPTITWAEPIQGLTIAFTLEPLGLLFTIIASTLWVLTSLYSIGYMRANNELKQTRFYTCFAVAISATMGIALASDLLTLFIFYEALTISTYPLVTHKGTLEARNAGRIYLGILIGTSISFLLFAIIWTWNIAGTLDFVKGGILEGHIEGPLVGLLLGMYVFGIGKAALMPVHRWLPAAMVAPTPVSALLHAVAVVKAGVFSVLKIAVYIFGVGFLADTGVSIWLAYVAAATILIASIIAMTKDNLKARLAYSTISQLSYVILGAMLATGIGVIGSGMHIAMHAVGKITLFFCAGAIYTALHKTEISDMDGIGRLMPWTMGAFFIAALSIIGLPPLGGAWSKWYLALGAADANQLILIAVLMISSLLNVAYLLPIPARAFFLPLKGEPSLENLDGVAAPKVTRQEAPLIMVIPLCLTALGCLFLFAYAGAIYDLLAPLAG